MARPSKAARYLYIDGLPEYRICYCGTDGQEHLHTVTPTPWDREEKKTIWVSLPYATFGLITKDGRVIEAPPIARWTTGKKTEEVIAYYRQKGGTVSQLAPRAKYPSAKFDSIGKTYSGRVAVPTEDRQARKFGTEELATWPDGNPVIQTRVVLDIGNDELVALYAQGRMAHAITAALVEANAPDIEVGGQLSVTFDHTEPSKGGGQAAKHYKATYTPPADSGGEWDPADID